MPTKLRNNVSEIYKPLKDTYYNFIHNQVISNKYTGTKYIENTLESEYGIYHTGRSGRNSGSGCVSERL